MGADAEAHLFALQEGKNQLLLDRVFLDICEAFDCYGKIIERASAIVIFDKNQTEFENCFQEEIWKLGTRLVPFEKSLPYIPDEYISACKDLYDFNQAFLTDMYVNPQSFDFGNDPNNVKFYLRLISGFQNLENDHYEMPIDLFEKHIANYNSKCLDTLNKHGFVFEKRNNIMIILNNRYPGMFIAANKVYEAAYANYKVNRNHFFWHCDFRALSNYKRTYEDLHELLNDERREIAEQIHQYCLGCKIKPQKCNYYFRVEYKYKGKIVYISDLIGKNQFKVNIGMAPFDTVSYERIINSIENDLYVEELKKFLLKNIAKKCINCKSDCETKKNPRTIFTQKRIICENNPFIRIIDPSKDELESIYKFIDFRKMLIDENISQSFYPGNG